MHAQRRASFWGHLEDRKRSSDIRQSTDYASLLPIECTAYVLITISISSFASTSHSAALSTSVYPLFPSSSFIISFIFLLSLTTSGFYGLCGWVIVWFGIPHLELISKSEEPESRIGVYRNGMGTERTVNEQTISGSRWSLEG